MIKDIEGLLEEVKKNLRDNLDIGIIGLSGGADSTLVAVLCKLALGNEYTYGLHMPYSKLDNDFFNARSIKLANYLKIYHNVVSIYGAVQQLTDAMYIGEDLSRLNLGNMKSRMRMIALYGKCCQVAENTGKRVRVVGTDNLSENYISFFTKYGDGGVDLNIIGSLYKSEVYQLLDYFKDKNIISDDMIDRIPSPGLYVGHTDEIELGHTYTEMEQSIRRCLNGTKDIINNEVDKFVWERHINGLHKNEMPPIFELRKYCE